MENCNPVNTPCDPNQMLHSFGDCATSKYPFWKLVNSLMYLEVGTRPYIAYGIGMVSRYLEKPKVIHESALKRILKM